MTILIWILPGTAPESVVISALLRSLASYEIINAINIDPNDGEKTDQTSLYKDASMVQEFLVF